MNDTKSIFQSDKNLMVEWLTVCKTPWFQKVILHARSSFMETRPTHEQIAGADEFLQSMLGLVDSEDTFAPMPGPGLIHNPIEAAKELKKQKEKKA